MLSQTALQQPGSFLVPNRSKSTKVLSQTIANPAQQATSSCSKHIPTVSMPPQKRGAIPLQRSARRSTPNYQDDAGTSTGGLCPTAECVDLQSLYSVRDSPSRICPCTRCTSCHGSLTASVWARRSEGRVSCDVGESAEWRRHLGRGYECVVGTGRRTRRGARRCIECSTASRRLCK